MNRIISQQMYIIGFIYSTSSINIKQFKFIRIFCIKWLWTKGYTFNNMLKSTFQTIKNKWMYFISRKHCLQLWCKQPAKMNPYLNNKEYNFPYLHLTMVIVIVSAMSYNTAFISQAIQDKYIKLVFPLIKTLSRGSFMVYYKSVRFCH